MRPGNKMKKIAGIVVLSLMVLTGYSAFGEVAWTDIPLEDVTTGETFKISDFKGKKVMLETFAVWCSTCTKQQKEIKKLHGRIGEDFVSITVDVDPNEDADKVRAHVDRNGFDWLYAVASPEMTRSLIDEFGTIIVNAPSAPIVIISEDGASRLLGRGVKSADKLEKELKG
jgi:peroxiredoxin